MSVIEDSKLRAGQCLGSYKILSQLGSGGMGDVYLADDTRLKRKVALKVLRSCFTNDSQLFHRFEQEAHVISALNHPNILTIHETATVDSIQFIVTEFVDGHTLRKIMTGGSMALADVLELAVQVASALKAAHESGIVHRDIKPENIMVRRDGYVKVLDFGIAKLTEKTSLEQADSEDLTKMKTSRGMLLGTVSYMSPEQAQAAHVDSRTDVWSLGVVLYEMLTGRLPFQGATPNHVLVSIQDHDPVPFDVPASEFTIEFERIVTKALAKNREERYQTGREFFDDLNSLQEDVKFKNKLGRPAPIAKSKMPGTSDAPELAGNVPNNLPSQLTPLIGRQAEALAVRKRILRDDLRLLTLTGPGGTGKTRLCIEVAANVLKDFSDGVFFIALAPIRDPSLIVSTIAQTLRVKEAGGSSILERLKEFLSYKQMLLAIDNFEQVIPAAPVITELLNASRHLKVLITSREPLRIMGEHEFPVATLPVPPAARTLAVETIAGYAAVELFAARASAVKPDFTLTSENAPAIAQICARLDGLPLAIELAAARVKVLPPPALLARLESRLKMLVGGARDLPSRQQTMRDAIAWSYDLLNEEEQKLFRRIAVFVRGCELESIEAVCDESGDLKIAILDGVASLVDKSLLRQKVIVDGEPRFAMLETIKEFGLEALAASGEASDVRRNHAEFFLKLAAKAEAELLGARQEQWLDKFEIEYDNSRAALSWCEENKETGIGLELAGALWRFWETRGYLSEGREQLAKLLSLPQTAGSIEARLKALYAAGILADAQCDYPAARLLFEEKLRLHQKLGDKWGVANSINNLGIIALREQDYVAARALYQKSLNLWQELGNERAVALALANLGNVSDLLGDYAEAHDFYQQSLDGFKKLEDQRGVALSLGHLGDVARHQGDFTAAASFYSQSLAILIKVGDKRGVASLFADMASMSGETGDYDQARHYYEESMVIFSGLGDVRGIAQLFEGYAQLASSRGHFERALRLYGAADAFREEFSAPLSPYDELKLQETRNSIRRNLSSEAGDKVWQEGRRMSPENAIQYALASDTV